jgi:hypothetical protein
MDSWANLTDDEINATLNAMPGGLEGYLKVWGWLTFAEAVQERLRVKNAPEAPLRPDMRATLEHVSRNLHDHACHAEQGLRHRRHPFRAPEGSRVPPVGHGRGA